MDNARVAELRYGREQIGDENDPSVMNRGPRSTTSTFQGAGDPAAKVVVRKTSDPMAEIVKDNVLRPKSTNIIPTNNLAVDNLPLKPSAINPSNSSRPQTRSISAGAAKKAVSISNPFAVEPPYMSERSSSSSGSTSTTNVTRLSSSSNIQSNASSKGLVSRPTSVSDRGYAQKFDIFVDSKSSTFQPTNQPTATSTRLSTVPNQQPTVCIRKTELVDKKLGAGTVIDSKSRRPSVGSDKSSSTMYVDEERRYTHSTQMDQVQIDMEQVTLQEPERKLQKQSYGQKHGDNYSTSSARYKQEAWAWDDNKDAFPASINVPPPTGSAVQQTKSAADMVNQRSHNCNNLEGSNYAAKASTGPAEPMCVGTPPDQILTGNESKKPMGTLETMHEMLNTSFSMIESGFNGNNRQQEQLHESEDEVRASNDVSKLVAKVWVVRYVDYTSKYGLGFLFNTGSAGVYFNDSTKIVLSADGSVFQYIERRRKDSSSNSEHSSQTHLINSYPPELQKKVTLLRHFRNYLIDQQKSNGTQRGNDENISNGADNHIQDIASMNLNANQGLIRDGYVSEGASAAVKFGSSSVRYFGGGIFPVDGAMNLDGEEEFDMPFLKKWVRTKHAILFRISNRTVQVVFYDRRYLLYTCMLLSCDHKVLVTSEVLLSSEARIITFVNKQGYRTEHSLDDVLHSG